MKKILALLILFNCVANAQIVNIPDPNFKTALLESAPTNAIALDSNNAQIKIDSNNDGEIQESEALAVRTLLIGSANTIDLTLITDATGIKAFANLTGLGLYGLSLTTLDISEMTHLEDITLQLSVLSDLNYTGLNPSYLQIDNSLLTALDLRAMSNLVTVMSTGNTSLSRINVANLTNLTNLHLTSSPIQYFDASGATALRTPDFEEAMLISFKIAGTSNFRLQSSIDNILHFVNPNFFELDISNCSNIEGVHITNASNLQNLNMTNCPNIKSLDLRHNTFTTFDISNFPKLDLLDVYDGLLTSLDFSNNPDLVYLDCGNNPIAFLNIKNGTAIQTLRAENTPSLRYICADESEIALLTDQVESSVVVGSYCSFTPGGDYNTISGQLTFDGDNNGCSTTDMTHPLMKIKISNGTTDGADFTDSNGNYSFFTGAGTHTITPDFENLHWFAASPPTASVTFPLENGAVEIQNFCIVPIGVHYDTEIVITPTTAASPGFDAVYKIIYKNKGNRTVSGTITLNFDDAVSDFLNANPITASQSTGTLQWNFSGLQPFESREIELRLNINSPVEIPAVNIDDQLQYTVSITHSQTEESPDDNTFNLVQTVVGAYDPNDKTCLEGTTITPQHAGKYLHYNINFENTGNADAVNVVVKDYIDPLKFDINSLQVLNSSHAVKIKVSGNIVEFIFENINLRPSAQYPIGGHGNVLFKIKTNPNLTIGDTVENTANIYFDYNAPIETNEVKTTFELLNNQEFNRDYTIKIHPNPVNDFVKIEAKNTLKSIQLFDIQGRILQTVIENKKETTLDLSKQSNGIYFLKINTEKGSKVEKNVKE